MYNAEVVCRSESYVQGSGWCAGVSGFTGLRCVQGQGCYKGVKWVCWCEMGMQGLSGDAWDNQVCKD